MNEPRNWKWMVPGMLTPIAGGLGGWAWAWGVGREAWGAQFVGFVLICWACVLLYAAFKNCREYFAAGEMERFEQKQRALATTPITLMAQALSGMHPEAVKVLDKFGVRTVWQVKVDLKNGDRDFILLGTNVHYVFIQFVLDHSNPVSLMPKRLLSEGSKKFDPTGLVTDYEQYDEFQQWLIGRMVVTRPFASNPSMFLPPWNVNVLAERMGFGDFVELEQLHPPHLARLQAKFHQCERQKCNIDQTFLKRIQ